MEKIEKTLRTKFFAALVMSVLFVAGIPLIPVGAVNGIYPVMIVGIVFTAVGFYGTPILWTSYGATRSLRRVVFAVEKENLYSVQEIASQLSMSEKQVRGLLTDCFRKGYLEGYVREGDEITTLGGDKPGGRTRAAVCPYCGANFTYQGRNAVCPYCGGAFTPEK